MKKSFFKSISIPLIAGSMLLAGCSQPETPADAKNIEPKPEEVTQKKPKPVKPQDKWDINTPDSITVIVNKERDLPADYTPPDLVEPDVSFSFSGTSEKKLMRKEAAEALEDLFEAAEKDGIDLVAVSGYRSYARQQATYQSALQRKGKADTAKYNARPGHSEHQTGLAIDVSSSSVNYRLIQSFGETKAGRWLEEHASKHGFIIRYPKEKEDVTGYAYEPWHIRYVGKELAKVLTEKNMVMEEYFSLK